MCGPGAAKWSEARPGATILRAIVVRVRRWTEDRGRRPIRAVEGRNRAWAVLRGARVLNAAAVVDTKAAAGDVKVVAAINEQIEGFRDQAEPFSTFLTPSEARASRRPAIPAHAKLLQQCTGGDRRIAISLPKNAPLHASGLSRQASRKYCGIRQASMMRCMTRSRIDDDDPCEAHSRRGFNGEDSPVVGTVINLPCLYAYKTRPRLVKNARR